MDYNIQISESGEQFNQTIEVDTEMQTVLFKVPAHNNVDHSNILHDFKMVSLLQVEKAGEVDGEVKYFNVIYFEVSTISKRGFLLSVTHYRLVDKISSSIEDV